MNYSIVLHSWQLKDLWKHIHTLTNTAIESFNNAGDEKRRK